MDYQKVTLSYDEVSLDKNEILMAVLGQLPFESFTEEKFGVIGYIPHENFDHAAIMEALNPLQDGFENITLNFELVHGQNWNAAWEQNFKPITIGKDIHIRAPFHPEKSDYAYEIIIEPKMSFGTGHHATTSLMLEHMLALEFSYTNVLDMGCGTGVLGIMASMLGAKHVLGIDIDEWAYENAVENAERNKIKNMDCAQGDAQLLNGDKFNIILANINRNILLNDMESYVNTLLPEGKILFSGFYTEDLPLIQEKADSLGLEFIDRKEKDNWVAALFQIKI